MKTLRLILFLFVSLSISAQSVEGLVAHYPFNGDATDASPFENHATIEGATLSTDRFGNPDSAYEFNGEDSRMIVLDDPSLHLEGDFTLVAYLMPYTVKDNVIFRKGTSHTSLNTFPAYGLSLSGTGHYVFENGTTEDLGFIATQLNGLVNPYVLNEWVRVIARREGNSLFFSTNEFDAEDPNGGGGFTQYFGSVDGNAAYDGSPLLIGSRTGQASNTFHGKIDDIKIYNRYLTLEEVTGLNFTDDPIGIEDNIDAGLSIYPNPLGGQDNLNVEAGVFYANSVASLYTLNGRLLFSQGLQDGKTTLDTSDLDPGIYFIVVGSGKGKSTQKIIKL